VNQRLAVRMLEKRGHSVAVAGDGQAALDALARESFDIVLMDAQMPNMDGFEATRRIRERERATGTHVPVVALTAHAMQGDRERCLEAGMDDYIVKPIRARDLHEAIARQRAAKPAPAAAAEPAVAILDRAALLDRVEGDLDLLDDLVIAFRKDCAHLMNAMHRAIDERDAARFGHALHGFLGIFRNVSATRAEQIAVRLQDMDMQRDAKEIALACARLDGEIRALTEGLVGITNEVVHRTPVTEESTA
jgi:CheY-like chemotaxis protein